MRLRLVGFNCENFKNLYIPRNMNYSYSVVVRYFFYESYYFKKSCALPFTKETLYSTLQNKIAFTFLSQEITYKDNI
jgi:hypothetical protein